MAQHSKLKTSTILLYTAVCLVLTGSCYWGYNYSKRYFEDPFLYVSSGDKDDLGERIEIMEEQLDTEEFRQLMSSLLDDDNMDELSIRESARFIAENQLCEYLPNLKSKYEYLLSLPKDTSWEVEVSGGGYRLGSTNDKFVLMQQLPKYVKRLERECSVTASSESITD